MDGTEGTTAVSGGEETPRKAARKPRPKVKVKKVKKARAKAKAKKSGSKKGESRQVYPRPAKGEGVIGTILQCLQKPNGASVQEIFAVLKKKFKSKGDSMLTTIRIQVCSLPKRYGFTMKKTRDEKRGLVYKAPASVKYDKPKNKA
jgi:hypothetical protein